MYTLKVTIPVDLYEGRGALLVMQQFLIVHCGILTLTFCWSGVGGRLVPGRVGSCRGIGAIFA